MYRRVGTLLLVVTVLAAPGAAFAAAPDRGPAPVERTLLFERIWDGLVRLLGVAEDDPGDLPRKPNQLQSVSAAEEGGAGFDPEG